MNKLRIMNHEGHKEHEGAQGFEANNQTRAAIKQILRALRVFVVKIAALFPGGFAVGARIGNTHQLAG